MTAVLALALLMAGCNCRYISSSRCLNFENREIGQRLEVGTVFTDNRVSLEVESLVGSGSSSGSVQIVSGNRAGGKGSELAFEDAVVDFMLPYPVNSVTLKFRGGDGNKALQINGNRQAVGSLSELDQQTIEGVKISVSGGSSTVGVFRLTGRITDFRIGGEELYVDDVCYEH